MRKFLYDKLGWHWHSQNLNEKPGGLKGSKWRAGRAWLHTRRNCFRVEWNFFRPDWTAEIGFDLGGEEELTFHVIASRLFGLYFGIDTILPRRLTKKWECWDRNWGREFKVSLHSGMLWINIFNTTLSWSKTQPWYYQITVDFDKIIRGKPVFTKEVMDQGEFTAYFKEGEYLVKWKKVYRCWSRPRWFKNESVGFNMEIDGGVPIPGKGENSWDIGDDAIYSMGVPASKLSEAIGNFYKSVYNDRIRHGSVDWVPEKAHDH